eukprot:CAMPEP_0173071728 /NCGR_PEP_ID=MMETSP1102-20130122/9401_1 /TAXON_ID=49646 /ORGANISM="Geminigera sp., Strain Caron Lab Isolate" /LENGTH=118 /DNA_ID=CAMNT_0013940275 /DNA_START=14 /DNA_END=370 /DNA_ORIENTATION=-
MAGKIKEFQKKITDDADFKETINGDYVFVEFHQSWSGPCDCVKPLLYRVSMEKEEIKFCTAASDKLPIAGKDHKEKVQPVFIIFRKGKPLKVKGAEMKPIEGANTPAIQSILDNISCD